MPKRTPRQPTRFVSRYRERLTQDMESKRETDRSLADKLTAGGYPISFTAIYKTRTGTRQPAMDECFAVAHVLGYASLDEMLEGPGWVRVRQAEERVTTAYRAGVMEAREAATQALLELRDVVRDPDVVAQMDARMPRWREEGCEVMQAEIQWSFTDMTLLWQELHRRVRDVYGIQEGDGDAQA